MRLYCGDVRSSVSARSFSAVAVAGAHPRQQTNVSVAAAAPHWRPQHPRQQTNVSVAAAAPHWRPQHPRQQTNVAGVRKPRVVLLVAATADRQLLEQPAARQPQPSRGRHQE